MTELDRVPVAQLPSKYGIVKSVLYDRINRLGIKPQKIGNKSYLSGEQLELLDQLDAHINAGGSMAEFADRHTSQSGSQSWGSSSNGTVNNAKPSSLLDKNRRLPINSGVWNHQSSLNKRC